LNLIYDAVKITIPLCLVVTSARMHPHSHLLSFVPLSMNEIQTIHTAALTYTFILTNMVFTWVVLEIKVCIQHSAIMPLVLQFGPNDIRNQLDIHGEVGMEPCSARTWLHP